MPGHKRNPDFIDESFSKDITEISGFDDLHRAEGLIQNLFQDAASLWNADEAIVSVNGSTGLLVSTVMALSSLGKILMASNCHISLWHGVEMSCGDAVLISPDTINQPFAGKINPNKVDELLTKDKDIKSIIITSPTYEGIISDIPAIQNIADKHGAVLVVDEAHGAHLGLNPYFPATSKADVVIKSIHKTLSAPTQTAVMLFYGNKAPRKLIKHYKDSTESSSPSYVLMDGVCKSIDVASKATSFEAWVSGLKNIREEFSNLKNLTLFPSDDPSKFVISSSKISGYDLSDLLRQQYKIELEAAFPSYVIAMTGIGDTKESLSIFEDAILQIDSSLDNLDGLAFSISTRNLSGAYVSGKSMRDALVAPSTSVQLDRIDNYVNHVSAEYLFAYPPGIPLLIPGRIISIEDAKYIKDAITSGLHLTKDPFSADNELFLVDTDTQRLV